jgi:hypothetical protein
MKVNIASGTDVVATQVGHLAEDDDELDLGDLQLPATVTTTNIRTGNAQVGLQADVIVGDLNL